MRRWSLPKTAPMVGRKYGHLAVLGVSARRDPQPFVWVRCDCGKIYETRAHVIRDNRTNRCAECRDEYAADWSRRHCSVRLRSGKTVAGVAQKAGLDLGTVYRRFLRGWPEDKLGLPLQVRGGNKPGRGLGRSHDLATRRGRMYGRQPEKARAMP